MAYNFPDVPTSGMASNGYVWDGQKWALPVVSVTDITRPPYSCVAGGPDCRAGLQAAIDAAIAAGGGTVYVPRGIYNISNTLSVSNSVRIVGDGRLVSTIQLTANPSTAIQVQSNNAVDFERFTVQSAVSGNTSNGIVVDPGSGHQNRGSRFNNIEVAGFANGITFERAYVWSMHQCWLTSCTANSIIVRNDDFPDNGDGVIFDCLFSGVSPTAPTNHILQNTSGGLSVIKNKFFYGSVQYLLQLSTGVATSNLFIVDNSMEGAGSAAIRLSSVTPATGQMKYVFIANNEIAIPGNCNGILIPSSATAWLMDVAITGNIIGNNATTPQNGIGAGMTIGAGANYSLTGNVLENWLASSGTQGIVLGSNVAGAVLAGNTTWNYGSANAVINNSVAGTP